MGKEFDRMEAIEMVTEAQIEITIKKLFQITGEAMTEWLDGVIPYDEMAQVVARCNVIILDFHNLTTSMRAEKCSIDSGKLDLLRKSTKSTGFWNGLEKGKEGNDDV